MWLYGHVLWNTGTAKKTTRISAGDFINHLVLHNTCFTYYLLLAFIVKFKERSNL